MGAPQDGDREAGSGWEVVLVALPSCRAQVLASTALQCILPHSGDHRPLEPHIAGMVCC